MIDLLDVNLVHIKDVDATGFNRFVMVDSQPSHHELFEKYPIDVVIDHHPDTCYEVPFQDIRPKYGATASILTEYLRAAKIHPATKLATALILGIKTDTSNFEQQTIIEDVRAFQFLFRYANKHLIRKIERSELRPEYLKFFKKALDNRYMHKGKVYVFLGPVVNPDVCVVIADFFLRISSIRWSIVAGYHQRKLIIIFRNDGLRRNAGKISKQSFNNIGSAGGHKSMARAEIAIADIKPLIDHKDDDKVLKWIIQNIEKKAKKPST
jgi:nanoRNase/pAp phosphatase (c-di-AMP/oligoRNAs hydrolase)